MSKQQSSISFQDIETAVFEAAGAEVKAGKHKIEPFTEYRNGIMGNHYALTVFIRDKSCESKQSRPLKFFVKTPPDSPILRDIIMDKTTFTEEIHFYDKVYPVLMQGYKGEKWSPACYLAKPDILIFEDLREQGYAIREGTIYDEESLKPVLATLARFHAASIVAEQRLGKPLNEIYPNAFCEKVYTDVGKGGRCNKIAFDTIELLAKRFHMDADLVPKILNWIFDIIKPLGSEINVVCHGDLWRSNIMFDDSATPPKCLLVDYQMLRYASPTVDFAMLIYVHTTLEFRKESEFKMLEYYYSILRETIELSSSEVKVPEYQRILKDYENRRIVGMAYSSVRWPAIVMANRDDPEALASWYFHNRIDVYQAMMDKDPVYERKIRGYLEELFDEGLRLDL